MRETTKPCSVDRLSQSTIAPRPVADTPNSPNSVDRPSQSTEQTAEEPCITPDTEELLALVTQLARHYTGYESSSVSVELLQQLVDAVEYCLNEEDIDRPSQSTEQQRPPHREGRTPESVDRPSQSTEMQPSLPLRDRFETGRERVVTKTRAAQQLYNVLAPMAAGSRDIRLKMDFEVLPQFFRYYDWMYRPQETVVDLDYPVSNATRTLSGVDYIYAYLLEVQPVLEREFEHEYK